MIFFGASLMKNKYYRIQIKDVGFSQTVGQYNNIYKNINIMLQDSETLINAPDGFDTRKFIVNAAMFTWNPEKTSPKLLLNEQYLKCTSKQGSAFKTTLGTQIFTEGGRYYFEIFINKGQLLKIGVCRPTVSLEGAFCDTLNGWGIYNGQLRHNSNSTGPKYGTQLKQGDIIGVAIDMVDGVMTYYRNGESWGVAYKDPQLKKGQLVAAVSPIYANDVFTLRSMIKQD